MKKTLTLDADSLDIASTPGDKDSLESIEAQIRDIQHAFVQKTTDYMNKVIYDVVAVGLYLLKAEMHFLLLAGPTGNVSGKSRKRNKNGQLEAEEGFTAWLGRTLPEIQERTSRNYRNAARRVGLTSDSSLEDIDKLRTARTLHGKSLSELYKALPAPGTPSPSGPETPTPSLVQATQLDLFSTLDSIIVLKDQMEPEVYEATHLRLKATLEKLTGAKWVMLDEAPSIDAGEEHGEMNHGKGKLSANDRARIAAQQKARWAKAQGKKAKGAKR